MNKNLKKQVGLADDKRKVNPLDLSSDQDLTIALMNLVAIEDMVPDGKIGEMVRNIRKNLMARMIADEKACPQAREYLSQAINKMNQADKICGGDAYKMYDAAYEAYVLYIATAYGISA